MQTIQEAIEAYVTYMEIKYYTLKTINVKLEHFKRFTEWAETRSITLLCDVTKDILYAYQKYLYRFRKPDSTPLAISTQTAYLASLRTFFNWLYENGHIGHAPSRKLESPKLPKKLINRGFSHKELKQIMGSFKTDNVLGICNRCLVELLYCTAMRRAEMARVLLSDIDHDNKTIFIREGKGRKDGVALFGISAAYWMDRYFKYSRPRLSVMTSPDNLFLTNTGKAFSDRGLGELTALIIKEAGIQKSGAAHLFRHTFAMHMLERGMDSRYIGEFLRHESLNTTKRYLNLDVRHLRKQFDTVFEPSTP